MVRSRIFGIVWILMALFYYIASDSWLAAAILLVTVGFFIYLPISVLSGAKLLKFRLSIQDEVIKNVPAGCRLLGKNLSLLPLAKAKVTVSFRNILTCSEESADFYMAASPRGSHEIFWDFKSLYAGKTEITVSEVTVYDFLGIFQKSFSGDTRHSIYVIPETFLSSVDISSRNAPNMDSDYYSGRAMTPAKPLPYVNMCPATARNSSIGSSVPNWTRCWSASWDFPSKIPSLFFWKQDGRTDNPPLLP